ncbi:TPA: flagellar basal body P-ring protein FlgI [Citrobacter koseri]|nr:flagellar basal body P-ring protein FlgI [Citrobacter koseri]
MFKSLVGIVLILATTLAHADRIRDLTSVQGVRENSLIGYGLVVGLDGTGDQTTQTPFTTQTLNNMLSQLGITVPTGTNMQLKNVAAVMVTAQFPAFGRQGQTIDVVVSSMGNAKSLRGGSLQSVRSSANLNNVVRALNALGATPMDLMSILQSMQSAGCLRAKLEII